MFHLMLRECSKKIAQLRQEKLIAATVMQMVISWSGFLQPTLRFSSFYKLDSHDAVAQINLNENLYI